MIELKFSHDDPAMIRANMASMLGLSVKAVPPIVAPFVPEVGEATDKPADTAPIVADTTESRKPRNSRKTADKPTSIVADVVPPAAEPTVTTAEIVETVVAAAKALTEEPQPNISANPENREPPKPLTLDDVRNAAMAYVRKFKLEMKDAGQELAKCLLETPAVGKGKISELDPQNQDQLAAAVAAFDKATAADKRYGQ